MSIESLDQQVGGDHYKKHGAMQPWEILKHYLTVEEFHGFMKGSAIVYLLREGEKGGHEDIGKAEHYLKAMREYRVHDELNKPLTNEGGWIVWYGGKCPVNVDTQVHVLFRDTIRCVEPHAAGKYRWDHSDSSSDIIAYKVVS